MNPLTKPKSFVPSFADALRDVQSRMERLMSDLLSWTHESLRPALQYSTLLGGKRLRPFLVMTIAEQLQVNPSWAQRVAAAVEFIHCYSLVHDDLPAMDNADTRRGKAACHKHFDEATAILTGDALQALAFEVLSEESSHPDPLIRCHLIHSLAKAVGGEGMVAGQILDLTLKEKATLEDIQHIHLLKSGRLIECSCVLPAAMASLSQDEVDLWRGFGQRLGFAFQIVDDVLDIAGTSEKLGKPIGQDDNAGKTTFVTLLGQEKALKWADQLIQEAINLLEKTTGLKKPKELLKQCAHYVLERQH